MEKNINKKTKIGFIGQGWIGKNYSDNFESRGFNIIRYAKEEPHNKNKEKIKECEFVFIAVPTPTTKEGFNLSILREVLSLLVEGQIVIIKSTIIPGTTKKLQKEFPHLILMHSPEFLTEATAKYDADNPERNIIGIPSNDSKYTFNAHIILNFILPCAPFNKICDSTTAETIKYASNCFLHSKIVFMNLLYDFSQNNDVNWDTLKEAMLADKRLGGSHMDIFHKTGRGAGGHCFIKDFVAFREAYEKTVKDNKGSKLLRDIEEKNIELLKDSKKDLDLLSDIYD